MGACLGTRERGYADAAATKVVRHTVRDFILTWCGILKRPTCVQETGDDDVLIVSAVYYLP